MGKVYESQSVGTYAPKVRFTSQEEAFPKNTWFVGTKTNEKDGKQFKNEKGELKGNKVFTFVLHDASPDLHIQKKAGKLWSDVEVTAGAEVEINGNAQLDDKIGQVPLGQKIKVTFLGKKLNENSGRYFNNYEVKDAE